MAQCDKAETNYVIKGMPHFDIFDKDLLNLLSAISSLPL